MNQDLPLKKLKLPPKTIKQIKNQFPELKNTFNTQSEYAIPLTLIQNELDGEQINIEYLIKTHQKYNIKPTQLFNYIATVFKHTNNHHNPTEQKQLIAEIDTIFQNKTKQQIYNELEELEEHTDKPFFQILHENFKQKSQNLTKQLTYNQKPKPQDLWEIQLQNIENLTTKPETDLTLTIIVEKLILPEETTNQTFIDSPALVRIVGEYPHHPDLNEGDMFVATPAAFTNGTYIKNINQN